jgi:holin-like protein
MIKQFSIIVSILAISYMLEIGLNLPIPASIIGMLLLLIMLLTKIIKLDQVEKVSDVLLGEITLFILPLSIGIMDSLDLFEGKFLIVFFIVSISTIISMIVTALIMKLLLNKAK